MALISLQGVRIAFGGPELLDGVTLQIERGERVCLVGRNGAGKSTLMRYWAASSLLTQARSFVQEVRGSRFSNRKCRVTCPERSFDVVSEGSATLSACSANIVAWSTASARGTTPALWRTSNGCSILSSPRAAGRYNNGSRRSLPASAWTLTLLRPGSQAATKEGSFLRGSRERAGPPASR